MLRLLARLILWVCIAAVLVLALTPQPPQVPASDKTQHVAAFFVLSLLAAASYPERRFVVRALWLLGLGAAIEFLQLIPVLGRYGDVGDFGADAAGILLSLPFIALAGRLRARGFASGNKAC